MLKRVFAGVMWTFATWCALGFLARFTGVADGLVPIASVAIGLLIAIDPTNRIWVSPAAGPAVPAPTLAAERV
jgi:hypothetical protein